MYKHLLNYRISLKLLNQKICDLRKEHRIKILAHERKKVKKQIWAQRTSLFESKEIYCWPRPHQAGKNFKLFFKDAPSCNHLDDSVIALAVSGEFWIIKFDISSRRLKKDCH